MNTYIKYNPADESTHPKKGKPVLCLVWDECVGEWGTFSGYASSEIEDVWKRHAEIGCSIFWREVEFPSEFNSDWKKLVYGDESTYPQVGVRVTIAYENKAPRIRVTSTYSWINTVADKLKGIDACWKLAEKEEANE